MAPRQDLSPGPPQASCGLPLGESRAHGVVRPPLHGPAGSPARPPEVAPAGGPVSDHFPAAPSPALLPADTASILKLSCFERSDPLKTGCKGLYNLLHGKQHDPEDGTHRKAFPPLPTGGARAVGTLPCVNPSRPSDPEVGNRRPLLSLPIKTQLK